MTGEEAAKEKNHHSHVNRPPVHSKPFVFIFSLFKKNGNGKRGDIEFCGIKISNDISVFVHTMI